MGQVKGVRQTTGERRVRQVKGVRQTIGERRVGQVKGVRQTIGERRVGQVKEKQRKHVMLPVGRHHSSRCSHDRGSSC